MNVAGGAARSPGNDGSYVRDRFRAGHAGVSRVPRFHPMTGMTGKGVIAER